MAMLWFVLALAWEGTNFVVCLHGGPLGSICCLPVGCACSLTSKPAVKRSTRRTTSSCRTSLTPSGACHGTLWRQLLQDTGSQSQIPATQDAQPPEEGIPHAEEADAEATDTMIRSEYNLMTPHMPPTPTTGFQRFLLVFNAVHCCSMIFIDCQTCSLISNGFQ